MRRLDNARRAINTFYVTLASTGAIVFDRHLAQELREWSAVVAVMVISILATILIKVTEWVVTGTGVRRLVLGTDDIEGTWIDVYPARDRRIRHMALVNIKLVDDHYEIDGETYDPETFLKRSSWSSMVCRYENRRLEYLYREEMMGTPTITLGAAHADFVEMQARPYRYNVRISDPLHSEAVIGSGFRVEDNAHLHALRTGIGVAAILHEYRDRVLGPDDNTDGAAASSG
jgi:hypothetical protein